MAGKGSVLSNLDDEMDRLLISKLEIEEKITFRNSRSADTCDGNQTNINVRLVDKTLAKRINEMGNAYPFKSKPRGRALIIYNFKFDAKDLDRNGIENDAKNIKTLLENLMFEVECHRNKKAQEMIDIARVERKSNAHKTADAFIFVVMSHGGNGIILGSDCRHVSLDVFFNLFDAKSCPALVGKPKIFMVLACRGGADSDRYVPADGNTSADNKTALIELHRKADFVFAYATVEGYAAYIDKYGSPYIQELVSTIRDHCHHEHLLEMMIKVNDKLQQRKLELELHGEIIHPAMTCETRHTTRKKIYFLPGYSETGSEQESEIGETTEY